MSDENRLASPFYCKGGTLWYTTDVELSGG